MTQNGTSSIRPKVGCNLKWGNMRGIDEIDKNVTLAYNQIVKWHKNIMEIPRGKCGKDLISELTRLAKLFNEHTKWEPVALHLIHIFLPIMLQKPSARSKTNDHVKYLSKRLNLWKSGNLKELLSECNAIQKK